MVKSGGICSLSECVCKDEMGVGIMMVEAECKVVIVAEPGGFGEK